ncbi:MULTISPECIES: hypothetical protein [Streptosporangium]|uniref:DUF4384 domain-containing protein n=1 Tax=Streptosporangium brasiliense TaxID=47480 RepID=A0ABT9R260_9ACTN|nr:hypothetical protein [Streptosporangium brasiliense]MDP9863310.1 hypothetical protein [Streptosporangium brasiliense]
MTHTEDDLRELLAAHSEGGRGGAARLEEIVTKGRGIRRRRRWAAAGALAAALAVVAVLTPVLVPGGQGSDIATSVREDERREEGVRLAGVRFANVGKTEKISFTPRSGTSSYRVNCAGPVQTFVRLGDQVDHGMCGSEQGREWSVLGRLDGAREGVTAEVEVFTIQNSRVPVDVTAESELSGADFERVLALAEPGPGIWEIAIHDGGVSSRSCSPDICLHNGTLPATRGERNLAGLPNSHTVESRSFKETGKRFRVKAAVSGQGSVYVRCEGEDLYAFIWPGVVGDKVMAVAQPCGPKPARWDFQATDGVTVAVVPRDQVPAGTDFLSDLEKGADKAREILGGLTPAPGNWEVAVQQWDDPPSKVRRSWSSDGTVTFSYED